MVLNHPVNNLFNMQNELLHQQLAELLKLEEAAQMEFNAAKNRLIRLRKKRQEIEKLLKSSSN
jgi:hypothetical protein